MTGPFSHRLRPVRHDPSAGTAEGGSEAPRDASRRVSWTTPDGAEIVVDLTHRITVSERGGPVFYAALVRDDQGTRRVLVRREEVEARLHGPHEPQGLK